MEQRIRLLDCTLRDGGHLNGSVFGESTIRNVIQRLVESKIDIIEVGFLWDKACNTDTARYYTIADVKRILPRDKGESKFALMADFIDLEHLEPNDGTIEYIRLSFKRHRLQWGLQTAKLIMEKGYKCYINPVNCNVYTDKEYLSVLEKVNELKPYGFSIVDTFGTMRKRELSRIVSLVAHNLDPDIVIGLHLHENLGLAYSLAQHFLEISEPTRKITIDCSLLGMGRTPGNLCTEQIMDHLNLEYGKDYNTEAAFDAIDDHIAPIKQMTPWGYSIPYALSAKFDLHRTYAEFLLNKRRLKNKDIQRILAQVSKDNAETFDEDYICQLYASYMDVVCDSAPTFKAIGGLCENRNILVIAPGSSIEKEEDKILDHITKKKPVIFSVNFLPDKFDVDAVFCPNMKRYDDIVRSKHTEQLIITSNLLHVENVTYEHIVSYRDVVYNSENFSDDSTVMLLTLLKRSGVKEIAVAGFDGFVNNKFEFYDKTFEKNVNKEDMTEKTKNILRTCFKDMKIFFITESAYRQICHENI